MCGVAVFVSKKDGRPKDEINIFAKTAKKALLRRGPDSFNTISLSNDRVLLCHSRLSILDLSPLANQPMISASGRFVMIFNGEIYNHENLRRDCFITDFNWRTTSDTETFLELIDLIGLKPALDLVDGMFAFCLVDKKRESITLVRDRFGEKPLYFLDSESHFLVGSTLSVFSDFSQKQVDPYSLHCFFHSGFVPSPYSIFTDVKKIEPGQMLTYCLKVNKILFSDFYFELSAYFENKGRVPPIPYTEFKKILTDGVRQAFISDVEIGLFQSGGIDSTTIAEISSKTTNAVSHAFNIGFSDKDFDESLVAGAISRKHERNYISDTFSKEDVKGCLIDLTEAFDEPFADTSALPMIKLSKLASEKVKVCLGGDGGDELFLGYNRYKTINKDTFICARKNKFINYLCVKILLLITPLVPESVGRFIGVNEVTKKLKKLTNALQAKDDHQLYWEVLNVDSVKSLSFLKLADPTFSMPPIPDRLKDKGVLDVFRYMDLRYFLSDRVLTKVDRCCMYHSVEGRSPFLNKPLFEYAIKEENNNLLTPGKTKVLLKKFLQDMDGSYKTSQIFTKKQGFTPPLLDWIRSTLNDELYRFSEKQFLKKQGIFKIQETRALIHSFLDGGYNEDEFIWRFIIFQRWYERYVSAG